MTTLALVRLLSRALKRQARDILEELIKHVNIGGIHVCQPGIANSLNSDNRETVQSILPRDKSHEPHIPSKGSAQRFVDSFGVNEPGFVWIHWTGSSWENDPARTGGGQQ